MKKFLQLFLTIVMLISCLCLVACFGNNNESNTQTENQKTVEIYYLKTICDLDENKNTIKEYGVGDFYYNFVLTKDLFHIEKTNDNQYYFWTNTNSTTAKSFEGVHFTYNIDTTIDSVEFPQQVLDVFSNTGLPFEKIVFEKDAFIFYIENSCFILEKSIENQISYKTEYKPEIFKYVDQETQQEVICDSLYCDIAVNMEAFLGAYCNMSIKLIDDTNCILIHTNGKNETHFDYWNEKLFCQYVINKQNEEINFYSNNTLIFSLKYANGFIELPVEMNGKSATVLLYNSNKEKPKIISPANKTYKLMFSNLYDKNGILQHVSEPRDTTIYTFFENHTAEYLRYPLINESLSSTFYYSQDKWEIINDNSILINEKKMVSLEKDKLVQIYEYYNEITNETYIVHSFWYECEPISYIYYDMTGVGTFDDSEIDEDLIVFENKYSVNDKEYNDFINEYAKVSVLFINDYILIRMTDINTGRYRCWCDPYGKPQEKTQTGISAFVKDNNSLKQAYFFPSIGESYILVYCDNTIYFIHEYFDYKCVILQGSGLPQK